MSNMDYKTTPKLNIPLLEYPSPIKHSLARNGIIKTAIPKQQDIYP